MRANIHIKNTNFAFGLMVDMICKRKRMSKRKLQRHTEMKIKVEPVEKKRRMHRNERKTMMLMMEQKTEKQKFLAVINGMNKEDEIYDVV